MRHRVHVQDVDQPAPSCVTTAEAREQLALAVAALGDLAEGVAPFSVTVGPCDCPEDSPAVLLREWREQNRYISVHGVPADDAAWDDLQTRLVAALGVEGVEALS